MAYFVSFLYSTDYIILPRSLDLNIQIAKGLDDMLYLI